MNDPTNNPTNNPMKHNQVTTDAELQAQFDERNKNLKQSLNHMVNKIDTATSKTQDFLKSNEQNSTGSAANMNSSGFSTSDLGNITGRSTSSVMSNQHNLYESDWGNNVLDRKMMNSIEVDILAMHSTDPELFENVASKMDETFGQNALV